MKDKAYKSKYRLTIALFTFLFLNIFFILGPAFAASFSVEKAYICEEIVNRDPLHPAVVFRNGIEKIYCYTILDKVKDNDIIYHNWYKKDRLSSRIKLGIRAPRWATYSSIQLRDYDNGPWRVDITDAEGHVLKTLRFSILD